jgi:dipeptidyl aminopeptidase/acylaminoacyl peptidase
LIPREILFGNPRRVAPRLSPDGRRLAYLAPDDGVLNVWVRTVGRDDDRPITRDRGRGIRAYFWAQNDDQVLYVQDKDGDENWHVHAVPAEGGASRDLTPHDGVQAQVIDVDVKFPDEILIALNDRDAALHDVYVMNVRTGERNLKARNDIGCMGWIADHEFRVRVAQVPTRESGFALLHRASEEEAWKPVHSWGAEDALTTSPLAFAEDSRTLYLSSSVGSDTAGLRRLDLKTGEEEIVASDPQADLADALLHPTNYRAQAVSFNRARAIWKVLDPSIRADFETLARLHHGDFTVVNRDRADRTWLVAYEQDRGPTVYFAYDRDGRQETFLFSVRPQLEHQPLAEMKPVSFAARDGMMLHAYLTLPIGTEGKNLPAILNVHGGPWARDAWGYDPEAQWMANRGYASLQVNFRGSTGYGKGYTNAGDREWGGRMQDDLTDAVRWLVDQGIADPSRVGIFGGSYGGYAVLSGLTTTPDLYACGVDIVGPSNLLTWMETIPPYWKPFEALLFRRVGHPVEDEAFLKERSPLFHVDAIRAPLLIAQGKNDPRVKREESLQIKAALESAGKIVSFVEFPDEGHGFARPENRLRFYALAEEFLARHLGGRCEPAGDS